MKFSGAKTSQFVLSVYICVLIKDRKLAKTFTIMMHTIKLPLVDTVRQQAQNKMALYSLVGQ